MRKYTSSFQTQGRPTRQPYDLEAAAVFAADSDDEENTTTIKRTRRPPSPPPPPPPQTTTTTTTTSREKKEIHKEPDHDVAIRPTKRRRHRPAGVDYSETIMAPPHHYPPPPSGAVMAKSAVRTVALPYAERDTRDDRKRKYATAMSEKMMETDLRGQRLASKQISHFWLSELFRGVPLSVDDKLPNVHQVAGPGWTSQNVISRHDYVRSLAAPLQPVGDKEKNLPPARGAEMFAYREITDDRTTLTRLGQLFLEPRAVIPLGAASSHLVTFLTVLQCPPEGLIFQLEKSRYNLYTFDSAAVPPGASFRVVNPSSVHPACLSWVFVDHAAPLPQGEMSSFPMPFVNDLGGGGGNLSSQQGEYPDDLGGGNSPPNTPPGGVVSHQEEEEMMNMRVNG